MNSKMLAFAGLALSGLVGAGFAGLGRASSAPPARAAAAAMVRSAASSLLAAAGPQFVAQAAPGEDDPSALTQWRWERVDSFGVTVSYGLPRDGSGPAFVLVHPEQVPDAYSHCLIAYEEIATAELRMRAADGTLTTRALQPVPGQGAWMLGLVLPAQSLAGAERVSLLGWTAAADASQDDEALIDTYVARAEEPL